MRFDKAINEIADKLQVDDMGFIEYETDNGERAVMLKSELDIRQALLKSGLSSSQQKEILDLIDEYVSDLLEYA